MSEEEYKECAWIDNNMKFYTYKQFKGSAFYLKRLYQRLPHKLFYKWYVYANIHLSISQKNIVWSFLNGDVSFIELDKY